MSIILLILEILHRAALILGVIYALDIAHNGEIDLYHPKIRRLKKGFIYRLVMKIADKLESRRDQIQRAWEYRVR